MCVLQQLPVIYEETSWKLISDWIIGNQSQIRLSYCLLGIIIQLQIAYVEQQSLIFCITWIMLIWNINHVITCILDPAFGSYLKKYISKKYTEKVYIHLE